MTLIELRYLVALAMERNFSRAAERCAVSQPSLSVAVAKIEERLGVRLFERLKGDVRPTAVGARVVEQARLALQAVEKVRHVASQGADPIGGPLRLGVIPTIGPYLLPKLISALRPLAPAMPLIIEENLTAFLTGMLLNDEIDAAIIALPFDEPGMMTEALYDERFQVIVPHGHPWQGRKDVRPEDIKTEEVLLLRAGNCFRNQVLGACPQVSAPESERHPGSSLGTLRCMVASGLGISVMPVSALQPPYSTEDFHTIPFAEPQPTRRIALAWRKEFPRIKALTAVAAAVRSLDSDVFQMVKPETGSLLTLRPAC